MLPWRRCVGRGSSGSIHAEIPFVRYIYMYISRDGATGTRKLVALLPVPVWGRVHCVLCTYSNTYCCRNEVKEARTPTVVASAVDTYFFASQCVFLLSSPDSPTLKPKSRRRSCLFGAFFWFADLSFVKLQEGWFHRFVKTTIRRRSM